MEQNNKPVQAEAPSGKVLVPKQMTQAMRDVTDAADWTWEDLLAAAQAITEVEYNELAAHPPASGAVERDVVILMVDAAMVEMKNITPPLRRNECERLIRAALATQPLEQKPVAYWIPKAEQFCVADPKGRPFAKAWEPLYAVAQPEQAAQDNRTAVDSGALTMALNVLRRAGKSEVANALERSAARASGQDGMRQSTFRKCEHCGCETNAKMRACCRAGWIDDKVTSEDRAARASGQGESS